MIFIESRSLFLFALIPVIFLLHLLKLRRGDRIVPSVMLWREIVGESGSNAFSVRIKRSLQLPLQIALISCLTLALARPVTTAVTPIKGELLLIIDASASMSAREDGEVRLDQAKKVAYSVIRSLKPRYITLVEAGVRVRALLRRSSDPNLVRKAIEGISPSDGPCDLRTAIILNFSDKVSAIALITDGEVDTSSLPDKISDRLMIYRIGRSRPNYGITGLQTTYDPLTDRDLLSVTVSGFNAPSRRITLWVYVEDKPFLAKVIQVQEGSPGRTTIELGEGLAGRRIGVKLEVKDALDADNSADLILPPHDKLRVLLVMGSERTGFFLERSLRSSPMADVRTVKPEGYLPGSGFDLTIFDNWVPPELPQGSFVFISPRSGLPSAPVVRYRPNPVILEWNRSHPIMRGLDLSGIRVKGMLEMEMPSWAVPLVETDGQPLIWGGEDVHRRGLIFCFDAFNPDITDFPLRPECPIMMENLIEWFSNTRYIAPPWVKVGRDITLNMISYPDVNRLTIITPQGRRMELDPDRPVFKPQTKGIYEVLVDGRKAGRFAANMIDGSESDLSVPTGRVVRGREIRVATSRRELWKWFAIAGGLLMILEWWAYHKRR